MNPSTATRSYAAVAYYAPNAERKNLIVITGAVATKVSYRHVLSQYILTCYKILFEKETSSSQRAVGVEFVKDGVTTKATNIKKDVIISTGAYALWTSILVG